MSTTIYVYNFTVTESGTICIFFRLYHSALTNSTDRQQHLQRISHSYTLKKKTESEEKEIKGELLLKGVDSTTEVTKSHKKSQGQTERPYTLKFYYFETIVFQTRKICHIEDITVISF
jgi:hypothetical protein